MKLSLEQFCEYCKHIPGESLRDRYYRFHPRVWDIFDISYEVNKFISQIYKNQLQEYTIKIDCILNGITLSYMPNILSGNDIEITSDNNIIIYKQINKQTYKHIKYSIMYHVITMRIRYNQSYQNINPIKKIRQLLYKHAYDKLSNTSLTYLLYRDEYHNYQDVQYNTYLTTYNYIITNKLYMHSHTDYIKQHILNVMNVSSEQYDNLVKLIYEDNTVYDNILSILLAHFSEFSKYEQNTGDLYFNNHVFNLPAVKELRQKTKEILEKVQDENIIANKLLDLKNLYINELLEIKTQIIPSFIKKISAWYKWKYRDIISVINLTITDVHNIDNL